MNYLEINKEAWNKRTKVHVESEFYGLESFRRGESSLNPIELEEIGNVKDKKLLHLQCHFGQDTLSWARLGATVTGVDLSSESIAQAKKLALEIGVESTFIMKDIYQFGIENKQVFDVVFTSYGALCWLPDLTKWANTIASCLPVGGELCLVEFHPFNDLLSGHSYFPQNQPDIDEEGTYTENCDGEKLTTVTWGHSLSEVITALISAGLSIESFKEYPYSPYNCFDGLEYVNNKGYQLLRDGKQVPLVYSITARKI